MAPLTRLRRSKICWFGGLPVEIGLTISEHLPLKDRLAFCDASRVCRTFVSDQDCLAACTAAGLKQVPGVGARAMAKLLAQPRKGVCNWSHEDGVPKDDLDFSRVWPVTDAIEQKIRVALHPSVMVPSYHLLREEPDFQSKAVCIARHDVRISLQSSNMYMYEYLTSPPLDEIRVFFSAGMYMGVSALEAREVAFRVCNRTGVTLGNFWDGLYRFLDQAPDPDMQLFKRMVQSILDRIKAPLSTYRPLYPDLTFQTPKDVREQARCARTEFESMCTTNRAMLDMAYNQRTHSPFTDEAFSCELPLASGQLELVIFTHHWIVLSDSHFIEEWDRHARWGEPAREPNSLWPGLNQPAPGPEEFWEKAATIIEM